MRLGAFTVVDAYPTPDDPASSRVEEVVELAEELERSGFASLWVAEHHFRPEGACPSPAVLLAACAGRTRTLRLGSLVSVLPFHRPVEVAEEYALLDRVSHGRLNFGVGSGYLPSELEAFGVGPSEKRELFERSLETILEGFRGGEVRTGARTPAVHLNVRPVQLPSPPLTIAVQRREALRYVAARGASVALIPYATVRDVAELAGQIGEYRAALPPGVRGAVIAAVHLYAGSAPELARQAFRRYVESRIASGSTHLVQKSREHAEHASPEAIEANGLALFGSPESVVERLGSFERAGVDELLGIVDFGGLPQEEVLRSIRGLGKAWRRAPPDAAVVAHGEGAPRARGL